LIRVTFEENSLAIGAIKCITSIDAKRNEPGLMEAAHRLGVPLITVATEEISSIEVPHPSDIVKTYMGVSSVCEATAILKSRRGRLLVPKTRGKNVTLAVAMEI
ncbi:MAG: cobalamin biosynthesis protein CbiG, partial [Nitrospiraceae bacterium]|nr:cobalamin biosynthesis protein CbiG [Nitrospiraceae bacterium]